MELKLSVLFKMGTEVVLLLCTFKVYICVVNTTVCIHQSIITSTGVLSSVVNVTVQEIDGSILIYWAAPFSLIPHDIWYDISILNLTNKRGIDCFDCTNITTTNYTFIPDNYGQCYEYVVTITAVNEVGMGEKIHHTVQNSKCGL